MKRESEGIVIAIDGQIAKVKASRHVDCASCGACPGDLAAILDVYNPVAAKVGQRVMIQIPETHMLKAAFIVYLLPLITAFAGFFAGRWIAQKFGLPVLLLEVGVSFVAFALTLLYIKYYDKAMTKTKMMPVITSILSEK